MRRSQRRSLEMEEEEDPDLESSRDAGGGGIQGDRGLYLKEAEHGRTIYCNAADSGPLQEDSAEARGDELLGGGGNRRGSI